MLESFWPNIAEIMIICDKSKVYLKIWEKIVGSAVAEIIIKIWERKDKWYDGSREKDFEFRSSYYRNSNKSMREKK